MPADQHPLPAGGKPADGTEPAKSSEASGTDRPLRKLSRRVYAFLGVIAVIGGVLAFGGQVEHWFSGLSRPSTCPMPLSNQVDRSPNLGVSFRQNGQLAAMDYVNATGLQIPLIDVCLSSAPFEIWFPALQSSQAIILVCTSTMEAEFRVDPFKVDQNTVGCMAPGTTVVDSKYSSGFLSETSPDSPADNAIFGNRAQPASNGDEEYYVADLYSLPVFTAKSYRFHAIPLSSQTTDLYMIIFRSNDGSPTGSAASIEHFALLFK